jgi:hypothetical protein
MPFGEAAVPRHIGGERPEEPRKIPLAVGKNPHLR